MAEHGDREEASLDAAVRALRERYPNAEIATKHVRLDDAIAVFRTTIALPEGGKATGYGASSAGGDAAVDEAERRALARALSLLGFSLGTPVPVPAQEPEAAVAPTPMPARPAPPERAPAPAPAARDNAPIDIGAGRERAASPPAPAPAPAPPRPADRTERAAGPRPVAAAAGDPPLEDYSWTSFWNWARKLGFESKGGIEELIGRPMTSLSPAEVRDLIRAKLETAE